MHFRAGINSLITFWLSTTRPVSPALELTVEHDRRRVGRPRRT